MMLWTGIFLVSSSVLTDGQWISIISPVFVVFLLTKVSGIPLLEVRADEKWKGNQAYEEYKKKTGVLFPKMSSIIEAMGGGSPSTAGDLQENLLIAEEDKPEP